MRDSAVKSCLSLRWHVSTTFATGSRLTMLYERSFLSF